VGVAVVGGAALRGAGPGGRRLVVLGLPVLGRLALLVLLVELAVVVVVVVVGLAVVGLGQLVGRVVLVLHVIGRW
jgi:hypothetical protein